MDATTNTENATIRVDRTSRKGSVVDVAKLVLGCGADEAEAACVKIGALPNEEQHQINGNGGLTAVAEVDVLIELVWLLPAEIADDVRREISHTVCKVLRGDPKLVIETEKRHIAMREKRLQQYNDMPVEFKYLSDKGREQYAFRLVELSAKARDVEVQKGYQDLRRSYNEIDEKSLTLKRKRMDDMIYCYSAIEELGISLDADARVHILDTVKVLTKHHTNVDGDIF